VPGTIAIRNLLLFYFSGETNHLVLKSEEVEGWAPGLAEVLLQGQAISSELPVFAGNRWKVLSLQHIKAHFPLKTIGHLMGAREFRQVSSC
jgi:hypothetical protein